MLLPLEERQIQGFGWLRRSLKVPCKENICFRTAPHSNKLELFLRRIEKPNLRTFQVIFRERSKRNRVMLEKRAHVGGKCDRVNANRIAGKRVVVDWFEQFAAVRIFEPFLSTARKYPGVGGQIPENGPQLIELLWLTYKLSSFFRMKLSDSFLVAIQYKLVVAHN